MIYIVHGEDFVKSRVQVSNQQKKLKAKNRIEWDILEKTTSEINEVINTKDLFGESSFIVLDVSNVGRTNIESYLKIIEKTPSEVSVVILSNKPLSKTNIFIKNKDKLKARVIFNEKIHNENIFKFVDNVFFKDRDRSYGELSKLLKAEENEIYIFTMILFGLRSIAHDIFKSPSFSKKTPFIKSKIEKQARLYSKDSIKDLFNKLYKLEKRVKTGEVSLDILVPLAVENVLNSN